MKRRLRFLRFAKWAGTLLCAVILAMFAVSIRFALVCGFGEHVVDITRGNLQATRYSFDRDFEVYWGEQIFPASPSDYLWPEQMFSSFPWGTWLVLPLWIPFAAVFVPTLAAWWLDRRRNRPVSCTACGYDLTGNESGTCPECGTPARTSTEAGER